jgi:hypothetical protein
MRKLTALDLWSLEKYARERPAFRSRVLEHKSRRRLPVGPNTLWCFEDRLTIQYQIQEMLRAERIFEPDGILEELEAYNPLIPDGSNWKATLLVEFPDPGERRLQLARLKGIERHCWVQAAGGPKVYAIADEDLPRENEEKTSAVHFLRFELPAPVAAALKGGAGLTAGVDHDAYRHTVDAVPADVRAALVADLA